MSSMARFFGAIPTRAGVKPVAPVHTHEWQTVGERRPAESLAAESKEPPERVGDTEAHAQQLAEQMKARLEAVIDSVRDRIAQGKPVLFGDRPGTLESRIQGAVNRGEIKSREDLQRFVDADSPKAALPTSPVFTSAKEPPEVSQEVIKRGEKFLETQEQKPPVTMQTAEDLFRQPREAATLPPPLPEPPTRIEEPIAQPQAPAAKVKGHWTEIGRNEIGQTLYEDQNGVRSYIENGVRNLEPVPMLFKTANIFKRLGR
jgi:hypothetical protein